MTGHRRRIAWVVAFAAAWLVLATVPAGAHEHPTPTERAAPGVVFVEARAQVEVSLVEHRTSRDPSGIHIEMIQSTSNPVLASASGFVVDPTGTIVTSGAITDSDLDRARIYAVNEAFRNRYGDQAPLSGDTRQRVGEATDPLQQRLEACYPPHVTSDAGGCHVTVTPTYVVYPYVTSQDQYGRLDAELLPSSTRDVAVLRVRGATSMPTVNLGESTDGARALAALGFTDIPEGADALQAINTHLAEVGGGVLQSEGLTEDETKAAVALAAGLTEGMRGGPLVAEQGQVVGFLEPEAGSGPPPATAGRLVDAGAIREVLSAAGVTPRQGPVDHAFERASHPFKNGGFAAAIPNLEATLELFPGHALAAANLEEAGRNVAEGTPGPAPPAEGDSAATGSEADFPWTAVLSAAAAVLLLAAVALVVVLRRRRQASGPGGAAGDVARSPGTSKPGSAKPGSAKPVPARPGTAKSKEGKPREGPPAAPSRTATGLRERPKVPSGVTGSGAGPVSVIEGRGSGPSGAPSRSVPGQRSPDAVGDGSRGASRAFVASAPNSSSDPDAPSVPASADSQAFCTLCGAALGPHHNFCGRCGRATG